MNGIKYDSRDGLFCFVFSFCLFHSPRLVSHRPANLRFCMGQHITGTVYFALGQVHVRQRRQ